MVVVQSGEAQSSASPEELDANEKKNRLRQRFEVVKKLGQGTYGKVQLAINKETQQEVAIKTIKKARIENEQDMLRIRREIQIMSSIHHPHIIHIYEVFENAEKIVLVMQYASGGELYDYLGCHKKLPEKEARRIFRQIATAIYYCHKYKICHRDLKLENILLDDKGNAKIADFGLSNMFDGRRKLHTFCGSPLYASPEIVKGMPYSGPEVDCWSLGVLLYTMVYGAMPFDGSNFKRLVKQIYEGDYYEPKLKSGASGIIRRLLTVDVSKRATIKEVCTDVWVNEGYDHSLLQIANDMACLTPVSLNSTLVLSPLPTKNAGLQIAKRNDPAKYNFPKCEGLNKGSRLASAPKRFYNDALLSKNFLSVITRNNAISRTTQSSTTLATNDISSEVASVLKDILSRVEKGLGQMNTNQSHAKIYDPKYNVATRSGRLLEKIKASKNQKQNHELDISCNRFHNLSSEENNFCMVNGDVSFATRTGLRPVIDRSLLSVEKYPARSDSIRNNRAVDYSPGHIPSNEVRLGNGRHLPVGNFRIRSASEKTKQNNENIVPIFNVTSVIPQRTRGAYSVQNNNVNTVSDHSYESVHSSDVQTNIYYPSNKTSSSATKDDQLNATVSCFRGDSIHKNDTFGQKTDGVSYSQDRNDMLYILNQICHQRKLSCGRKQRLLSESMWQPKDEANVLRIHTESPNVFDTDISTFSTATTLKISKEPSQGSLRNGETEINNTEEQDQAELVSKMPSSSNVTETLTVPSSSSETTRHTENEASVTEEAKLEQETENPSKESSVPETPAFEVDFEETSCTKELNGQSTCSTDETEIKNPKQSDSLGLTSNHKNKPSSDIVECPVDQKNNDFSSEMAEFVEHRQSRNSRSVSTKKTVRSLSADDENRTDTLERILRRPRKYSLCALLAATFELERTSLLQNRRASEGLRKLPGKVEIPKSFDPSSESESGTPVEKKEIVLFPTVTVAENKQKIENKIEKVKNSALSMKIRRKSEASTRKKLKKYTRSCTDVFQCIGNANLSGSTANDVQKSLPSFSEFQGGSCEVASNLSISAHGESESGENLESDFLLQDDHNEEAEVAEGKTEAYVPITRCCKKIMFLPVSSKSYEPDEIKQSVCPQTDQERTEKGRTHVREIENGLPGRKEATRENTKPQETTKIERARRSDSKELENSLHCKFDQSKILKSNDSLNNSSLDKDSSDNDDEDLDPMIFDAQLEACETADLWKFLKTINNNLSCKIKKVAKLHSQPVYNRSKSQECQESDGSNRISENVLIRSRSKDEAPSRQSAKETLESLEDIGDSISSFEMLSFDCRELKNFSECDESTNHSESMPDTASSSGFFDNPYRTFRPKSMSAKYYSSSNLLDSSTFLSESSLQSNPKNESYNSSVNLSYGDSTPINDEMHSALCKNISVYGKLRPRSLAKSERTKTGSCTEETEQSHLVTLRASKQNSSVEEKRFPALNNKALSDMDISYRVEAPLSNSSPPVLSKGKVLQSSSRFAKSLGSKLDLQPRSILTDSASKDSLNKPKDDKMPKKHRRKVSFTSDSLKQRNTTFAMESLAKAQKILCESESNISSNPPDETGTLLEALKTHGYKTLISQRLQENAPDDNETTTHSTVFLRGLNSCNFANIFASNLYDSLNTDALEYARIMHIRRLMSSFSNAYNQFRDPDYTELPNGLHETTSHGKTDTSWCKIPSAWLYQNTETMRHSKPCVMPVKDVRGVENDLSQLYLDARYEITNQPAESRLSGLNIRTPCQSQRQYFTHAEQEILNETSTENSVEKLAMRIQALKSRYHQRSSDEHNKKRIFTQSLEFEEEDLSLKKPDNKYLEVKQSLFDSGFAEKREEDNEESVSDRIWRKSFYPRFNDTSTLKKRRSMLLETDYCSDETPQQSTKLRLQTKNLPREHDGRYEKRNMKAQNELLLDSRESQKNESSSQKTEQSIPSRTEPSEVEKEWPKEEIQETKRNE